MPTSAYSQDVLENWQSDTLSTTSGGTSVGTGSHLGQEVTLSDLDDPLTWDFFEFDFDFTDYADESIYGADYNLVIPKLPPSDPVTVTPVVTPIPAPVLVEDKSVSLPPQTVPLSHAYQLPQSEKEAAADELLNKRKAHFAQFFEGECQRESSQSHKRLASETSTSASVSPVNTVSTTVNTVSVSIGVSAAVSVPPIVSAPGYQKLIKRPATSTKPSPSTAAALAKAKALLHIPPLLPPTIALSDPRRAYAKQLVSAFNSCDAAQIQSVLLQFASHDMVAIHRYEGIQNPYGRNLSRVKGRESYCDMWRSLIRSAPDFFFDVLDTRAFYDPSTLHVIVASKFTWFGTRVRDVMYSSTTSHTTSSTAGVTAQPSEGTATVCEGERETEGESIFKESSVTELRTDFDQSGKFFVAPKPLPQRITMRCRGSLLVYFQTEYKTVIDEHQALLNALSVSLFGASGNGVSPPLSKKAINAQKTHFQTQAALLQQRLQSPAPPLTPSEERGRIYKLEFVYTSSDEKVVQS